MEHHSIDIEDLGARIELTSFSAGEVTEIHAMLHIESRGELFEAQINRIQEAEKALMQSKQASFVLPQIKQSVDVYKKEKETVRIVC